MRGYCGKILDIDLSDGRVKTIRLEEEVFINIYFLTSLIMMNFGIY